MEDALAAYEQLTDRHGHSASAELAVPVVNALFNKVATLEGWMAEESAVTRELTLSQRPSESRPRG